MSSIYEHLAKAHLKSEKDKPELEVPIQPRASSHFPKPPRFVFVKSLAFVSLLVSVGAAAASYLLFDALRAEQAKRASLEAFYNQLLAANEGFKTRDQAFQDEFERIKHQMNVTAGDARGVKNELERVRIEVSNFQKKLLAVEDSSAEIARKFESLSAPAPAVQSGPSPAYVPAAAASAESDSFAAGLDELTSQILPDAPAAAGEAPAAKAGPQVMTINRNFNFVVLNIGARDNVKMGERMTVEQKGNSIATVEVEKLYDNFSAATIVEERSDSKIQEGDAVRRG